MLKLKDKTKNLEVIAPWDPAIDSEKSDKKGYLETLDESKLTFKPGQQPSKLYLLPASKWLVSNVIVPNSTQAQMQLDLARHSLQKITNLKYHLIDSEIAELSGDIAVWQPEQKIELDALKKEILFSTRDDFMIFNLPTIQLIATIVQSNAFLVPGTKKPYAALLTLSGLMD